MAEDLSVPRETPRVAVAKPPAAPVTEAARHTPVYRTRFALAYLALAILAGVAIGATVLLADGDEQAPRAAWSNWEPGGRESSFPNQIADYVSGRYRLPSDNPLVGILPQDPPMVQDVRLRAVAIRNDPEGNSDDISIVGTDNSVMYVMCGLGQQCSISEGEPSEERHRLLRREALELALYTFKYGDADSVIALLPPRLPQEGADQDTGTATALFFEKKDFTNELDQPLQNTLLAAEPPQVAEISSIEGPVIDRLTKDRLFSYEFTQAQEGSAILVLAPIAS